MIIGPIYSTKLAAVGIACIPFVASASYVQLRIIVLKDQASESAHAESAHMACKAAGIIHSVTSLTCERGCLRLCSDSLKAPLKQAWGTNTWSTYVFALSQSMAFKDSSSLYWCFGTDYIWSPRKSTTRSNPLYIWWPLPSVLNPHCTHRGFGIRKEQLIERFYNPLAGKVLISYL
jgi:hypothetical protein